MAKNTGKVNNDGLLSGLLDIQPTKPVKQPTKPAIKDYGLGTTAELITRRRRQMVVHSCIYYGLGESIISDATFDKWAKELAQLQRENPILSSTLPLAERFKDFTGVTGYSLYTKEDYPKATHLLALHQKYGEGFNEEENISTMYIGDATD